MYGSIHLEICDMEIIGIHLQIELITQNPCAQWSHAMPWVKAISFPRAKYKLIYIHSFKLIIWIPGRDKSKNIR